MRRCPLSYQLVKSSARNFGEPISRLARITPAQLLRIAGIMGYQGRGCFFYREKFLKQRSGFAEVKEMPDPK